MQAIEPCRRANGKPEEELNMAENPWPNGVPEIMPAQDRAEIEELFARYAWGIDLADEEQAIATFAEDAEFDHLWQGTVKGHAAIRENLRKLWYDRQHWWYGRQHMMNHFIMDPMPEGARVRCFFQIIQWNADYGTNFVFGIGTRDDRLVKRGGRWKFYRLHVNAWTAIDQIPWKGERTLPQRPRHISPPADTRPFDEQTNDPW
jgi:hypothetical protein